MCKHWASFALDISMSLQQNIAILIKPCIHSLKKKLLDGLNAGKINFAKFLSI